MIMSMFKSSTFKYFDVEGWIQQFSDSMMYFSTEKEQSFPHQLYDWTGK